MAATTTITGYKADTYLAFSVCRLVNNSLALTRSSQLYVGMCQRVNLCMKEKDVAGAKKHGEESH